MKNGGKNKSVVFIILFSIFIHNIYTARNLFFNSLIVFASNRFKSVWIQAGQQLGNLMRKT